MTKPREPLTFERALTKIASQIGWPMVATIAGRSESAVRNWSDQDTSAGVRLEHALALDVAHLAAGGQGAPLLQVYQARLETELRAASADRVKLSLQIAMAAKEGGEAFEAATLAALPGASESQLVRAELELEESIAAQTNALAQVRALRFGVPEVTPPDDGADASTG